MTDYRAKISLDTTSLSSGTEALGLAEQGTQAFSRAMSGDLVGALQSATIALKGLALATKANVFLAIAAGAIAAGLAIRNNFTKAAEDAEKRIKSLKDEFEVLQGKIDRANGAGKTPVERAQAIADRTSSVSVLQTEREKIRKDQKRLEDEYRAARDRGDSVGMKRAELSMIENNQAIGVLAQAESNINGRSNEESNAATVARQRAENEALEKRREAQRDDTYERADTGGRMGIIMDEIRSLHERIKLTKDLVEQEELRAEAIRKGTEMHRLSIQERAEQAALKAERDAEEQRQNDEREKNNKPPKPEDPPKAPDPRSTRSADLSDEFDLIYQQQARGRDVIRMRRSRPSAFNQGELGARFRDKLLPSSFARSREELNDRRKGMESSRARVVSDGSEIAVVIKGEARDFLKTTAENSGGMK